LVARKKKAITEVRKGYLKSVKPGRCTYRLGVDDEYLVFDEPAD
jgi:hypothetical protein